MLYIANRLRWKSFAVAKLNCNLLESILSWTVVLCGQKPIAQAILLEKFHGYRSIFENRKTFSPRTICNSYTVHYDICVSSSYIVLLFMFKMVLLLCI